ncbi:RIP homotypic interaction motif-containing protein [Pseudomonas sp. FP2309]|uniref:RIP homotypic interaction motif-containing protein n=1 Tax=Pseudomonas sp. FP2309 TaxID=2954091 RepID=UPI00273492E0|nr:RIP homotypic interaction motif-containing protein [Pseudomonas sp. FP2309]WLH67225.1 RIP homotypic interaction motif-containing protein [Pseudomonas sp. FP2309]
MDDLFSPEAGNDIIHIERNGTRTGPYRCMFSRPRLTLFYGELDICEGDKLLRSIPGREETYTVELVDYHQSFDGDIPACYVVEISKDTAIRKPSQNTTTNHINIHGSTGIQIGDHNVQNLEVALKEVLASIDNADAPKEEREEAKNRLNAFLAHPLVSAAVGASLPVALGLLS